MNDIKMTYIADDSTVGVNGEFYKVEINSVANIRAIQWYGKFGEIEHNDGMPNIIIDNADNLKFLLEAWNLAKLKSNKPHTYSVWSEELSNWIVDENLKKKHDLESEIGKAKFYLEGTDFKMLPDYTPNEGAESIESVKEKRFIARELIRKKELLLQAIDEQQEKTHVAGNI